MTSLLLSTAAVAQGTTVSKDRTLPKTVVAMNSPATIASTPAPATTGTTSEAATLAEAKSFKGVVVDDLGEPLAGVVVSVVVDKNQFSTVTTTNSEGEYLIQTKVESPLLLVSYAGYQEIQQRATYAQPLTFQLESIDNYERQLKKRTKASQKAWNK